MGLTVRVRAVAKAPTAVQVISRTFKPTLMCIAMCVAETYPGTPKAISHHGQYEALTTDG